MESWILAIIIIFGVSAFIAVILANRKKWREDLGTGDDPVEHYTEARDELSGIEDEDVEEDEEEPVSSGIGGGINVIRLVGQILGLVITIFVGMTILDSVATVICDPTMNVTMEEYAILGTCVDGELTGIFDMILPIIGILGVATIIFSIVRPGTDDDEEVEEKPKKRPRKKGIKHYTAARDKMSGLKKK